MSDGQDEYDAYIRQPLLDELATLRERLEQAERERDEWRDVATKTNHLAEDLAHRAGFREGIEASVETCRRMRDLHAPTQEAIYDEIRALAPTDNTTPVAEAADYIGEARLTLDTGAVEFSHLGTVYEGETITHVLSLMDKALRALAAQKGG